MAEVARELAREIASRDWGVVTGGGSVGLMGIVSDEVLTHGGEVIGVMPRHLVEREISHPGVDLHVVDTMHTRKALMYDLADMVVALPGGYGTLDELFEALTWNQLGLHTKPTGLLDKDGYFAPLLDFLDGAVSAGFLRAEHRALLLHGSSARQLLDALAAWEPVAVSKWISEEDR
jgi:uncharacterized protein (TIGR00730 family)